MDGVPALLHPACCSVSAHHAVLPARGDPRHEPGGRGELPDLLEGDGPPLEALVGGCVVVKATERRSDEGHVSARPCSCSAAEGPHAH